MPTTNCQKTTSNTCETCTHRLANIICSTSPEVWKVLDQVKVRTTFKPNQVIFYQESEPLGLYTVSAGLVKLETTSSEGQAHTLRYVGPGSALGYRSLFAGENYHAGRQKRIFYSRKRYLESFNKNYSTKKAERIRSYGCCIK